MKQFAIFIRSFADIQDFVELSSRQPFDITLGEDQQINGKSLMAVLALNFRHPILVNAHCDDESFGRYRSLLAHFLV